MFFPRMSFNNLKIHPFFFFMTNALASSLGRGPHRWLLLQSSPTCCWTCQVGQQIGTANLCHVIWVAGFHSPTCARRFAPKLHEKLYFDPWNLHSTPDSQPLLQVWYYLLRSLTSLVVSIQYPKLHAMSHSALIGVLQHSQSPLA